MSDDRFTKLREEMKRVRVSAGITTYEDAVAQAARAMNGITKSPCAIDSFFAEEAKKPAHRRVNYCHISCPCSKCNPRFM